MVIRLGNPPCPRLALELCWTRSLEVAEACLSHRVGSAVSRAYARSDMLERRRPVMSAWERYVTGTGDNVIQMRRA